MIKIFVGITFQETFIGFEICNKKKDFIATLQSLIQVFNYIKVCRHNFSCLVTLTLHNLVFYDIFSDEVERLAKVCKSN